jgi:hypothetical protein
VPFLVPLLFTGALAGALVYAAARSARAAGFTQIDTRRVRLDGPEWTPPDWEEWIAVRVADARRVSSLDPGAIDALVEELAAMPNVLEVGEAEVVWPDGLSVELTLRRPVACVRSRGAFLTVAEDGVVLPGYWSAPPDTERGFLSVIGPNDGAFDGLVPGDRLVEERHLDALSVAVSALEHLPRESSLALGPLLIDASRAADASVGEPGTRLFLEQKRIALYGRPPRAGLPGELPETEKWAHLERAAGYLDADPPLDWDLIDLRWDRARLRPRGSDE